MIRSMAAELREAFAGEGIVFPVGRLLGDIERSEAEMVCPLCGWHVVGAASLTYLADHFLCVHSDYVARDFSTVVCICGERRGNLTAMGAHLVSQEDMLTHFAECRLLGLSVPNVDFAFTIRQGQGSTIQVVGQGQIRMIHPAGDAP